jgi:ketosteroid isomerase-like protein
MSHASHSRHVHTSKHPSAADLVARVEAFDAAVATTDPAKVLSLFTSDARVMPHDQRDYVGTADIKIMVDGFFGAGVNCLKQAVQEIDVFSDHHAMVRVSTQLFHKSGALIEEGRGLFIYRKEGGQWLVSHQTWSTGKPPVAPTAAAAAK